MREDRRGKYILPVESPMEGQGKGLEGDHPVVSAHGGE